MSNKKLFRSRVDCKIGGVCAGLAEYFNIDATIVRIIAILLIFADGVGFIGYIIAWVIVPRRPVDSSMEVVEPETIPEKKPESDGAGLNIMIPGAILIVIGLLFLVKNSWWWFDFGDLWPILLIIIGILMLIKHGKKGETESKIDESKKNDLNQSSSGEEASE